MISRSQELRTVRQLLREFPVVCVLGARQVGKTTLAKQLAATRRGPTTRFDLQDPVDLGRLSDPGLALRPLRGLVVLDEIQHLPEVFPLLRALADRRPPPARFLVLGSASGDLLRQTSESLAGRIAYHRLDGFGLREAGNDADRLWFRGGFPRSFLAKTEAAGRRWRNNFIETFLARDLASWGSRVPPATLRRFWTMLAHWHGQLWNGAEIGRSFGVSHTAVRRYLDLLTSLFLVRQLPPWFENLRKRQSRSPKIFLGDSGILHSLLGIATSAQLLAHPKMGASWEGFVIGQIIRATGASPDQCYHWSAHSGASLDLLLVAGARRYGFEVKRAEAPRRTASMAAAFEDLRLDRLEVVHAGTETYEIAPGMRALPVRRLTREVPDLGG